MDTKQYLTDIVEPTIRDFENNPTSLRHAFLACVVTFHSIDYLTHPKKPRQRRESFRLESPEFATVDRVTHAFKHVQTRVNRSPLMVGQVIERPPANWGEAGWGLFRWGDPTGGVTIEDEHDLDLLETVKKAAEFVRAKLSV